MKKLPLPVVIISLCLFAASCGKKDPNDQVDEGSIAGSVYTSDEIGWTITIPDGWSVVEKSRSEELQAKGQEAITESTGESFDTSGMRNLVGFQKNQFNLFQSTSEPFDESVDGDWSENNAALRQIILQTYSDQGISTEATEIETVSIGGLEFEKYTIRIMNNEGDMILNQVMYSRLINGLDFGVNINYNEDGLGEEMLKAWRSSKFER